MLACTLLWSVGCGSNSKARNANAELSSDEIPQQGLVCVAFCPDEPPEIQETVTKGLKGLTDDYEGQFDTQVIVTTLGSPVAKEYKLTSFPALFLINDGEIISEIRQARNFEEVISWLDEAYVKHLIEQLSNGTHPVVTINEENFEQMVLESDKPVLIDFWATWCGPCKTIAPAVELAALQHRDDLVVGKVDIDANPEIADRYVQKGIPNFVMFSDGRVVDRHIGAPPPPLFLKWIKKSIKSVEAAQRNQNSE